MSRKKVTRASVSTCLRSRSGTTLVELLASLMLLTIVVSMAAVVLHGAYRIYQRIQRTQDAYAIVDTLGTELQDIVGEGCGYVKLYADAYSISGQIGTDGKTNGSEVLEFLDSNGYVMLVSAEGCSETQLYTGTDPKAEAKQNGTFAKVEAGQLVVRYYTRENDGRYSYQLSDGTPVARAAAKVYGEGFYMDYRVKVSFRLPENIDTGTDSDTDSNTDSDTGTAGKTGTILADVSVMEKSGTETIASDTFVLDFRRELKYSDSITAKAYSSDET